MQIRFYILFSVFLFCVSATSAQSVKVVFGKVISQNGEPIPGVSVISLQNRSGAKTDSTGVFRITIKNVTDTLQFSHVGFKIQTVPVTPETRLPLSIELILLSTELKEIILNTGYEEISRERVTGSFVKLDNELLNQQVTTDILSRLEGITSSYLVDKRNPSIPVYQIRGISSLTGRAMEPLIILDNFPYEGDLNNINPNDVQDITILKDAAATSIWGARAGNDVIVITSRKPRLNQPLNVVLNSNVKIAKQPDLFSAGQISPASIVDLVQFLYEKGKYNSLFTSQSSPPIPEVAEILEKARMGVISESDTKQQLTALRDNDIRYDMEKYLYRPPVSQQYFLSLNGGSNKMSYLFSAGLDKSLSELIGNSSERISLRSLSSINLTKNWTFSSDVTLTRSNSKSDNPGGYGSYTFSDPTLTAYGRLVNADGTPAAIDRYYRGIFTDTAGGGRLLDWKFRPLDELENNDNSFVSSDVLLNLGTRYRFNNSLSAEVKYQYQQSWTEQNYHNNLSSYTARDIINKFTQLTPGLVTYIVPMQGILQTTTGNNKAQAFRGQFNYDGSWNANNHLSAIIGGEIREAQANTTINYVYGYDDKTLSQVAVDFVTRYPTYNGGSSSIPYSPLMKQTLNRFVSAYGNFAYTYKNRYTLSASARKDASNLFGVNTNQKWVPLWSTGMLWKIGQEDFYNVEWMPILNIRMTYGVSGNLDPSATALSKIVYYPASISPINIPSAVITAPPNPELRWEKVKTMNVGLDFGLGHDRLYGSLEFYSKQSVDLMNDVPLDPVTGLLSARKNSASLSSKGVDIVLNSLNIDGKIKWKTTLLFNYIKIKVTKSLDQISTDGYTSNGTSIVPLPGYNPYLIVSNRWAGLDPATGDPLGYLDGHASNDYNAMRKKPFEEQVISGSAMPPVFGSIRNTIEWNKFSLAVNIVYKLNYYFRKPVIDYTSLFNYGTGTPDVDLRWKEPGDEQWTNVPSMIYPANSQRDVFYQRAAINVKRADHVRLTDIYLSYDWNVRKLKHRPPVRFYLYASQLGLLLWKRNNIGMDPEIMYNIKPSASLATGIKINF